MRKEGPMILTVISSLVVVFSVYFFLGQKWNLMDPLNKWFQLSYTIALALGFVNLTSIHWKYIQRKREGWFYSIILLVVMYGYLILGLYEQHTGVHFDWIYTNIMSPLSSAVFSLVAFFITSAAYRAFRVRTKEATILLVFAVFVLLGRAPIGDAIWGGWSKFVSDWIMGTLNTAGMRGIQLGAAVGAFATALRIMLGLERAHIGGTGTQ
ncbi:MAG: hypothetical protein AB1700_13650 [Bacillota bacterium]